MGSQESDNDSSDLAPLQPQGFTGTFPEKMLMLGFASVFPWEPWRAPLDFQVRLGWSWGSSFLMSSLYDANILVSTWRGFPLWELLIFTTGQCVSLRKRTQNFFHIFTKSICFSTFYRETTRIPPELLEGAASRGDTEVPVALEGSRPPQPSCLLYWSAGKRRSGQFSSKTQRFPSPRTPEVVVSIVTTEEMA